MNIQWPEGLNADIFLRDYWQKKPLLIRQAFPDWDNPIDTNELAGLAMEPECPCRLVLEHGERPWQLVRGPFSEEQLSNLPRQGWSLLVSDVEKQLPDFIEYLAPFRFIPDWRIDDLMISAAPDGGSVGAHTDEYDVFLLQGSGRRRWQIGLTPDQAPRLLEGIDLKILADFQADEDWVLEPGDMLYLPPHFAHNGIAVGDECMTWSIGFRAPSAWQLTSSYLEDHSELAELSRRYSDPALQRADQPGQIREAEIDALISLMRATLGDEQRLRHWLGCYLTEPCPEPSEAAPALEALPDDMELERRSDIKALYLEETDGSATLFIGGEFFPASLQMAKKYTAHHQFTVGELAQNKAERTLLHNLLERGWLRPLS